MTSRGCCAKAHRAILIALVVVIGGMLYAPSYAEPQDEQNPFYDAYAVVEYIPDAELLIGCWNDYPILGNGLRTHINFHEDSTFILVYDDADFTDPRVSLKGRWAIIDGLLEITMDSLALIEGAEIRPDSGLGQYGMTGGHVVEKAIVPPHVHIVTDPCLHYDTIDELLSADHEPFERLSIMVFDKQFWKMDD